MSFENLAPPIRLSYRRRAILEKVVKSDLADQILEREEKVNLTARRELIAERDVLPAQMRDAQAKSEKRSAAANARFEAARRELKAADDEVKAAHSAVLAADPARRVFEIERELKRTADNRLSDFRFEVNRIRDLYLPSLYSVVLMATPSYGLGRAERLSTNLPEISAARTAIDEAKARLAALELAAVSRADVTKALLALIDDLRPALDAVGLVPPGLNPSDDWEVTAKSNKEYADELERIRKTAPSAAA